MGGFDSDCELRNRLRQCEGNKEGSAEQSTVYDGVYDGVDNGIGTCNNILGKSYNTKTTFKRYVKLNLTRFLIVQQLESKYNEYNVIQCTFFLNSVET